MTLNTAQGTHLDVIILLGAILVKQATGSWTGHKQDGLKGDFPLSGEVDVCQRVIVVLFGEWLKFNLLLLFFKDG